MEKWERQAIRTGHRVSLGRWRAQRPGVDERRGAWEAGGDQMKQPGGQERRGGSFLAEGRRRGLCWTHGTP